jgi:hypothetical protein
MVKKFSYYFILLKYTIKLSRKGPGKFAITIFIFMNIVAIKEFYCKKT